MEGALRIRMRGTECKIPRSAAKPKRREISLDLFVGGPLSWGNPDVSRGKSILGVAELGAPRS